MKQPVAKIVAVKSNAIAATHLRTLPSPVGLGEGEVAGSGVALLVTVCPKARPTPAAKTKIDKAEKRMAEYASGTPPVCKSNL